VARSVLARPFLTPYIPLEITGTVVQIVVNGERHEVHSELTINALLVHLDHDPEMPGIAVALNETVVRRADWTEAVVKNGDRVEIITASQGG